MKLIRPYFQRIQRIRKEGSLFLDTDLSICHQSEIRENWFLFSTGDTFTRLSVLPFCYFFIHSFIIQCGAGIQSHFCSFDESKLNTVFTLLHRKLSSKPFQSLRLKGEKNVKQR